MTQGLVLTAAVVLLMMAAAAMAAAPLAKFTVEAGKHERIDTPVSVSLKSVADPARPLRLEEVTGGKRVAVALQVDTAGAPTLCWILSGKTAAGAARTFELLEGSPDPDGKRPAVVLEKALFEMRYQDRPVLAYRKGPVDPPEGVDPKFRHGAYIHPVKTPSGLVVTDDFPPDHRHQRGVWMSWTKTKFEGRHADFWNLGDRTGAIRFVSGGPLISGPVFAAIPMNHEWLALDAAGGDKVAMKETWDVRLWAVGGTDGGYWLWDLTSTQRCAGASPVKLPRYYYGGLGYRGPPEWLSEVQMLTSEGKTRKDGNETKARWCDVSGPIGGKTAGVLIMSHPANFRHPEPLRLNPQQPQVCFAPSQEGDWAMEPGKDYVWRYRFCVHDGPLKPEDANRLWADFGEPPVVKVDQR